MEKPSPLERVNSENQGITRSSPPARRPTRNWSSTDDLLSALANFDRRRLVRRLCASAGPVPLWDVVGDSTEERDDRTDAVALHHVHLPKLTDVGVATYDREADEIATGANADRAAHLLDAVAGNRSSGSPDRRPSNPLAKTCSTDETFRLLANETRRFVLSQLDGSTDRVHLDDLAEGVAAWKAKKSVSAVTANERTTTEIELHQRHLPMLSDAGVLEYDREAKTLPRRGHPVAVAEWLAACPALETFETMDGV